MSHKATVWAFSQKLPALQKLVLIVLADRHNGDTGRCDPSMERISEDCGMSKRSVRSAIRSLETAGIITAIHRFEGPVQLTNSYRLNIQQNVGGRQDVPRGEAGDAPGGRQDVPPNQELKPVIKPREGATTKKRQTDVEEGLPEWVDQDAWNGFVEMRTKLKKPISERAKTQLLKKLREFCDKGYSSADVLDYSTTNCWQGLFEPKDAPKKKKPYTIISWDEAWGDQRPQV